MSGLGVINENSKSYQQATFDLKMATSLYNSLNANGLISSARSSPKMWKADFQLLRGRHSEEEIEETLKWYKANLKQKFVPKVYSARKFREKYTAIRAAMQRTSGELPKNIEPGVEITEKARKLKNDMNLNWPGEEHLKELAFIQLNLNYCESFSRRLKKVYEKLKEECDRKDSRSLLLEGVSKSITRRLLLRVIHLYHCHLTPIDMTRWWLEHVNNTAWNWSGWQGNLLAWVLTDSNPRFNQAMSRILADEFGSGASWTQIKTLIWKEK